MRFLFPILLTPSVILTTAMFSAVSLPSPLTSAAAPAALNREISPILSDKCFPCHGPDKANRVTELPFDSEAGAKITLSEGRQSVVAGDPDKSELFSRMAS